MGNKIGENSVLCYVNGALGNNSALSTVGASRERKMTKWIVVAVIAMSLFSVRIVAAQDDDSQDEDSTSKRFRHNM
jgi:hypothetical protein